MIESEWLEGKNPLPMLQFIRSQTSSRKLRLFACACCREDDESYRAVAQRSVEVAERYADGKATEEERETAERTASDARRARDAFYFYHAAEAAWLCLIAVPDPIQSAEMAIGEVTDRRDASDSVAHFYIEADLFADLVRDLFGNPFRPVAFLPEWRTSAAVKLAETMYQGRDFSPMPALGDALEEAGCADPHILAHCRGDRPHVRGCWVVDLVLGEE
jgi:hypothetical protein